MPRWLQIVAAVPLLVGGALVLSSPPILSNKTYERGEGPFGVNLARQAGLPPGSRYEPIFGFESVYDWHGDLMIYYCFQLEADPKLLIDDDWRVGPSADEGVMMLASFGRVGDCFHLSQDEAMFDTRAVAVKSEGVEYSRYTRLYEGEATFLSLHSGRVLYVQFFR